MYLFINFFFRLRIENTDETLHTHWHRRDRTISKSLLQTFFFCLCIALLSKIQVEWNESACRLLRLHSCDVLIECLLTLAMRKILMCAVHASDCIYIYMRESLSEWAALEMQIKKEKILLTITETCLELLTHWLLSSSSSSSALCVSTASVRADK